MKAPRLPAFLTVKEIAARMGFSNIGYFIRVFRKFHGVTPRFYRLSAMRRKRPTGPYEEEGLASQANK